MRSKLEPLDRVDWEGEMIVRNFKAYVHAKLHWDWDVDGRPTVIVDDFRAYGPEGEDLNAPEDFCLDIEDLIMHGFDERSGDGGSY